MLDKSKIIIFLALTLIIIAVALMIEQFISWGTFWDWEQVLHHENFAIILVLIGSMLLITVFIFRNKCNSVNKIKFKPTKKKIKC